MSASGGHNSNGTALTAREERTRSRRHPLGSWRWRLFLLAILVVDYWIVSKVVPDKSQEKLLIPYSFFMQQVNAGNIAEVDTQGDIFQGVFKHAVTYPLNAKGAVAHQQFSTVRPTFAEPGLENELQQQGAVVNARSVDEPRAWWLNLLLSFGPTLLLIGGVLWLTSRASSPMRIGRSRALRYDKKSNARATFNDVAGIDEARDELVEVVSFLRDPAKYTRLGGTAPKGVLLIGPPGTGKTLLARAVAGEAGVPFFSMGASEFVEMIIGVGASRVRDLFRKAKQAAPAIIFIDELDAIGRARGGSRLTSSDEREQTLNQILSEMDGFGSREGVIVLAATNRPDVLDSALLRPGRFDKRVVVQPPDKLGREAILRVHTRGLRIAGDVDLKQIAAMTPGLAGADLKNLANEAALVATRQGHDAVHHTDFLEALENLVLGPARRLVMTQAERERIAYHEGGHSILSLLVPGADPVNRVTIMPRGMALGVTYQRPEDDRHNFDEASLRARIISALGGRAAEEVVYGTHTTGAENDLEKMTELARQMVTRWGMSEKIGPVTLAARDGALMGLPTGLAFGEKPYSEATAQLIDAEVKAILEGCYAEAMTLLKEHRRELDALAGALLEKETLDEDEIFGVTGLSRSRS